MTTINIHELNLSRRHMNPMGPNVLVAGAANSGTHTHSIGVISQVDLLLAFIECKSRR